MLAKLSTIQSLSLLYGRVHASQIKKMLHGFFNSRGLDSENTIPMDSKNNLKI
jgi:hypothetical protein